jgi:hypothetical protein
MTFPAIVIRMVICRIQEAICTSFETFPGRGEKMRTRHDYVCRFLLLLLLTGLSATFGPIVVRGQKLKPDELVAKHLEAIGPAETRQSIKSRVITGTSVVTFKDPGTGQVGGRAVLAGEDQKILLAMVFDNSPNYAQEQFAFDGSDVTVSYVRPGVRSPLADFILTYKNLLKQGLIGGSLSQAWSLLDVAGRKAKLEVSGTKKIGEREAYQVKFTPSGGSDVRISIFLDAETFQHVRTEYNRSVVAPIGSSPETSARQSETRYKMVEEFSDFRKAGGLTLPYQYKILFEVNSPRGAFKADWEMALTEFGYNQRLDPASFKVDK